MVRVYSSILYHTMTLKMPRNNSIPDADAAS
jgi:hypothetical protein